MTTYRGIRVADLAAEVQMTPAELVGTLVELGVKATGPNAILDSETAETVRSVLRRAPGGERVVEAAPNATVRDIAAALGIEPTAAVKKLMELGELIAPHQRLAQPLAERLVGAFGYELKIKEESKVEAVVSSAAPAAATPGVAPAAGVMPAVRKRKPAGPGLQSRPPVVTVMGHVDHGKTSLLDTIRKTHVVDREFGGITQHIGAYQVELEHNGEQRRITFLDTPGHAAFTQMRARGASVTDIVILVVAADDGVMPQTVEAINHARAAEVPIIVAINKIDRPEARPDRIKQQLTEYNLVVEEYGGDVVAVPVSAITGEGVTDLLEYVLLVADVQELKADPTGPAIGAIVEASIVPGRGPVCTVLVQGGTLHVGDAVVAGSAYGKVRAMTNERGEKLQKAGPSTPVEVAGFDSLPQAGDTVDVLKSERDARQKAQERTEQERASRLSGPIKKISLEDLSRQAEQGVVKDLNIIVKGDVQGSVEAVVSQLTQLEENKTEDEVRLSVKHSAVGPINEGDVSLAVATGSIVVGFNVRADPAAHKAAERAGVDVRIYNVIYDLTEDIDRAMKGLLTPIYQEAELGVAEVRQRFQTPRGIVIAGCFVTEGKVVRGAEVRVVRAGERLFASRIDTLRRIKDDVREVAQGFECGIVVENWTDVQVGDLLQCYEMQEIKRV